MADKDNQWRLLGELQRGAKNRQLKHGETVDKSGLPRKSEMVREIKAQKEVQKADGQRDAMFEEIVGGDKQLKKTETVDKTHRSKEDLAKLIQAEQDSYKQAEKEDRSAVLADVAKGEKKTQEG